MRPVRPQTIQRAVYVLIARCIFAIGAALAFFGARADIPVSKTWSPDSVQGHLDSYLKANLISSVVFSVMVLILAWFIWNGRNWGRWLYLEFALLFPGDVLQVLAFLSDANPLLRVFAGLTGLSAIVALIFLFLPPSASYLRKPGARPVLAGLLKPRMQLPANTEPQSETTKAGAPASLTSRSPNRPARAKSRRTPNE